MTLYHSAPLAIEFRDGRADWEKKAALKKSGAHQILQVKCVPYYEMAKGLDEREFHSEMFLEGAFTAQLQAREAYRGEAAKGMPRIMANVDHDIFQQCGEVMQLTETRLGLLADIRLNDSEYAEKVWRAYAKGTLLGVSAEFVPLESRTLDGGICVVSRASLIGIAFAIDVGTPAYKGATVYSQ